jgi:hypothetical protein
MMLRVLSGGGWFIEAATKPTMTAVKTVMLDASFGKLLG